MRRIYYIGRTPGAWVEFKLSPGFTVNQAIRFSFHFPVWMWRGVTHWYLAFFGKLYTWEA